MSAKLLFDMGPAGPAIFFTIYIFFPIVLLILFFFYRYFKHKERMALIERNKDISVPAYKRAGLLVAGSVFSAIGLGVLVSIFVAPLFRQEKLTFIILITSFVGMALLTCYFYLRKKE